MSNEYSETMRTAVFGFLIISSILFRQWLTVPLSTWNGNRERPVLAACCRSRPSAFSQDILHLNWPLMARSGPTP